MRCKAAAKDLNCLVQIHAGRAPFEVEAIIERHGRTSIEWLDDMGFLTTERSSDMACSRARAAGCHEAARTSSPREEWSFRRVQPMVLLAAGRATGILPALRSSRNQHVHRHRRGPQSMVESMRFAALSGKVMERRPDAMTAQSAFNAATINAANALRRPDLGRLAEGAKADIVAWATNTIRMVPLVDPIRNLVYYAGAPEVRDVMVDGGWVVEDGTAHGIDLDQVLSSVPSCFRASPRELPRQRLGSPQLRRGVSAHLRAVHRVAPNRPASRW